MGGDGTLPPTFANEPFYTTVSHGTTVATNGGRDIRGSW